MPGRVNSGGNLMIRSFRATPCIVRRGAVCYAASQKNQKIIALLGGGRLRNCMNGNELQRDFYKKKIRKSVLSEPLDHPSHISLGARITL